MLKNALFSAIEEKFEDTIVSYQGVTGGDINQALELTLRRSGRLFIKYNVNVSADLFEKEAVGLAMLKHHLNMIYVPKVYDFGVLDGGLSYLILEFLDRSNDNSSTFEQLGRGVAELHQVTFSHFGLDTDNYIGVLPQVNTYKTSFSDFFWECRIFPLFKKAVELCYLEKEELKRVEQTSNSWNGIFPSDPPSLLHGDLWIGNVMNSIEKGVSIIDPAIYYGHREMELAFTSLFGGFADSFYQAYNEVLPLESGFEKRKDLYQLYPVLVHLILFGRSYLPQTRQILKAYL